MKVDIEVFILECNLCQKFMFYHFRFGNKISPSNMALELATTENPNYGHSNTTTFETKHFQDRQRRQAAFASPKTVFISNFHNDTTQEEIRNLFSKFGTIDFDRMKKTDRKSFAWVTFTDENFAKHAINELNRTLNLGGQLHVEKFRDKSDFPHMREKTDANKSWIHFKINGVSKAVNHNKIQEMLGKFGKICKIRIMIDKFSPGYWVIFSAFDSMATFTDFKNNCDGQDFFKKGSLLKVTLDEFYLKDSTATRKIVEKSPRNVLTDQDKSEQNLSKLYGAKGTNLCVTGIPDFVKLGDFSSLVEGCGPVVKLRMVNNKLRSGQLVAYVTYRDIESAEKFESVHHKTDAFSWGTGVLLWVTKDWHDKKISRSNAAQAAVVSEKLLKINNYSESFKSDIDPSLASYLKPNHNSVHSKVLTIVPPKLPHTPIMPLFQIPKRPSYSSLKTRVKKKFTVRIT